ncbi:MAG TPA: trypsin-like peptidase domain-containing protein [Acidobacteriaceae bacterium]|jgi:serine protease Do|nr:trypsin-like peptidase domain-containing protein [Acidobacteriaceae bacterium]
MKALFERLRSRRLTFTFTILVTLSTGILIGSVVAHGVDGKEAQVNSSDAAPLQVPNPVNLSTTFTQIAKEVGPAVVNINTESIPKARAPHSSPDGGQGDDNGQDGQGDGQGNFQDFFNHFFGVPNGPGQGPDQGGPDDGAGPDGGVRESIGSGFIVDPRGYIITNNHVIDKADKIYVKLASDPEGDQGHLATLVGTDKDTDIAVIKINVSTPLPTVKMGNSDSSQTGDWVMAIGSPFDLQQTVTAGIVSSKNRSIDPTTTGEFQHFIQTDAAINPGNSGGPLVNMAGQVIGVNTAIYTQSAGNQGIGFAMPSNTVISVYNQLIGPGHKVVRGSIGISFQPQQFVSSAVARVYGFKNGVIISSVQPGFGAANAGLKPGDIITTIDGREVKNGDDLVNDISARAPGSTAKIGYIRNGQHLTTTVTISDRAKMLAALGQGGPTSGPGGESTSQGRLGMGVRNIPPDMANKLGLTGGVLIDSIRPGSFADELQQLQPGLVILQVNRKPVNSVSEFQSIVSALKPGDDIVFLVTNPRDKAHGNSYVGGTMP